MFENGMKNLGLLHHVYNMADQQLEIGTSVGLWLSSVSLTFIGWDWSLNTHMAQLTCLNIYKQYTKLGNMKHTDLQKLSCNDKGDTKSELRILKITRVLLECDNMGVHH